MTTRRGKVAALSLAKLSPPRLRHAVPRERLFSWLDRRREDTAALWLCGAPGAGKTSLAASYLLARGVPHLWYRFDADDNDIARFFATLDLALAEHAPRAGRPVFGAEHLGQPHVFARRWFRSALSQLPHPFVLVFDNLEQAALAAWPELFAVALDECPQGVCLLITSRHAPPPELATAQVKGLLAVLPAADLAFDGDEGALLARELALEPATVATASQHVEGWAAGLRLLCDARRVSPRALDAPPATPQLLFGYFATLTHEGLDESAQQVLLVGALLPWLPAELLASVAGVADARAVLDRLCAHNLFVEPVARAPGHYRLHPLLREFLLERGRVLWSVDERHALQRSAALAFDAIGDVDTALDLALNAQAVDLALPWLMGLLEARLARGQLEQWAAWVRRLPPETTAREPALQYGLARIAFLREDPAALAHYEAACEAYAARGDMLGQQLCAAGVLEWSYNTDSFIGHDRWAGLLRRPLGDAAAGADEQTALRLLNGRLLACFFVGDFDGERERLMADMVAGLDGGGAANEKLSASITLLGCLERRKHWDDAAWLAGRMETLLASPAVGPRMKILARQQIAVDLHRQIGAYEDARRLAAQAREQAHEQGFTVLEFEAVAALLLCALHVGDEATTRKLLADLAPMLDAGNVYHQRFRHQMQAWHALQTGQIAAAREHAQALRAAVARSEMPARFRATWLQVAIYADHADGRAQAAHAELAALVADAEPGSREVLRANALSLAALAALRDGDLPAAARALDEAWRMAEQARYFNLIGPLRGDLAALAAFALEQGVASGFANELIARRRLRAPTPAALHWPWPLRVHTLGRFALEVQGRALVFEGKVPRKPLALLKALIAQGADVAPVAERLLTDALWPDDEADAAHDAFNVALHRLRKLLPRGAEIVRLHDGCLSLDAALCWIDCRAFEHEASAVTAAARQRALALYHGHFLAADADAPWSVSARERLRSKLHRLIAEGADACAAMGQHEEALEYYRRGLEIDDLDEAFYRGAMRCALALGRPAEGIAVHRRLERMLATQLGVAPSAESKALLRQLLAL